MDRVVSVRTTERNDQSCILIKVADDRTIALKTNEEQERMNWRFAFQKSVAVVLNRTISEKSSAASSPGPIDQLNFRRMISVTSSNGRSLTVEDLPSAMADQRRWIRSQSVHGDIGELARRQPWALETLSTERIHDDNSTSISHKVSFDASHSNRSSSRTSPFSEHENDDCEDPMFDYEDDDDKSVFVSYGDHRFTIPRFKQENSEFRPKLRWRCGSCSDFGAREKNEDRFVAIEDIETLLVGASLVDKKKHFQSYFAVYDGHGGCRAAEFVRNDLHENIFRQPNFYLELENAIAHACMETDRAFLARCKELKDYSGTTALGAIIRDNELTVFNIGDCQAVLGRRGDVACSMNVPHKPGRSDETDRIKLAGGWVTEEKELYLGRLHQMDLQDPAIRERAQQDVKWATIHRVCGELAVSRSIGDPDYKGFTPGAKATDAYFPWPDSHDQIFHADLVIPNPEFQRLNLKPGDEFLIIASDGLWDVVTEVDAVGIAGSSLRLGKTPDEVSRELKDRALRLGSSDNITVVVVQFFHDL